LKAFEDKLRTTQLPQAKLDRDTLLYQAGWAAALASQTQSVAVQPVAVEPVAPATSLKTSTWAWKTATGSLAMVASILALLLIQQSQIPQEFRPATSQDPTRIAKGGTNPLDRQPRLDGQPLLDGQLANNQPGFYQSLLGLTSTTVRPVNWSEQQISRAMNDNLGSAFYGAMTNSDSKHFQSGSFINSNATTDLVSDLFPF